MSLPAPGLARSQPLQLEEPGAAAVVQTSHRGVAGRRRGAAPRFEVAPCVLVVLAVAVGIVLDRYLEPWGTQKWVGVALVFAAFAVFQARRTSISVVLVLAAIVALGGAWHHARYSDLAADDLALRVSETPRPAWIRGVVRDALGVRAGEGFGFGAQSGPRLSTRFVLDVTEISDGRTWHAVSGRAMAIVTGDVSAILAGQSVEAAGQIGLIAAPMNPGEFDYRAFQRVDGTRLRFTVDDPQSFWRRTAASDFWPREYLGRIRSWARARLFAGLDPSVAPLAAALLLGQREGIEPEVNDAFARTGTTHLLAISGLQLQALAYALLIVFRVIGLARRRAYVSVAVAMIGYAALVGPAPSVARATVMTAAFCVASISHRLNRPANTLALAGLGTLAINPSFLFDVGCQLSFLAIGALIWLVPPAVALVLGGISRLRDRFVRRTIPLDEIEREFEPVWRKVLRRAGVFLAEGLIGSTVVTLAALPLVAMRFHLVSPIGILLNLPLIPLTTAALLLGGLALVASSVWGPLGAPFAWCAAFCLNGTKAIVLWGVDQRWGHRFVVGPSWGWVLVFYVLLVLAVITRAGAFSGFGRFATQLRFRAVPWWLLVAWVGPGWLFPVVETSRVATAEAEFLAVGHGLAVSIQTPDGGTYLYDCGRLGDPSVGRRIVAPALWNRGVGQIDAVFLSHADQDHYDGLVDLLDRFSIGEVRITPRFGGGANPAAVDLLARVRSRGIPIKLVTAPGSWERGGMSFTIRHPPAGWDAESTDNARSIVLDLAFAGRHVLLTGDLELSGLESLVGQSQPNPPPEAMLAPHHGGRVANPEWLYEWARPKIVIASQRPPAVPANDPLGAVERMGIPVLRTWREGAIRISWTGDGVITTAFHDERDNPHGDFRPSDTRSVAGPGQSAALTEGRAPRAGALGGGLKLLVGLAGFILGLFACLVIAVIEIGAWALVMPNRRLAVRAPGSSGESASDRAVEEIMTRAADGVRLVARWFPASGVSRAGRTVLLLHGFAETSRALEAARATALNGYGWNVAALDSRGHGRSEGAFSTFGGLESRDIQVWLDELAARVAQDAAGHPFQPVLWGRSMGGAIALRAASHDARPVALVLEAPMVDLIESTVGVLRRRRIPFPVILARWIVRRAGKLAGMRIDRPSPVELAASVSCRTVIIHGMDDPIVPVRDARRLGEAFRAPPHWFEVPGAKHTDVVDKGGAELLAAIAQVLSDAAGAMDVPERRSSEL